MLIKIGLADIRALTFAGLRYLLAFVILLPLALRERTRAEIAALTSAQWRRLAVLGLVMYSLTQGAQFLALAELPAQTASLVLSFSPVAVALAGSFFLGEHTSARQWAGVAVYLAGAVLFLYPVQLSGGRALGLLVAVIGLCSNAGAALLGRAANRDGLLSPMVVTVVSMGIGAITLLVTGISVD